VLRDIANEELEHVGELMRVLKEISPTDFDFYKEGGEEVEEMIKKLKGNPKKKKSKK
jgi:rubrerythrin